MKQNNTIILFSALDWGLGHSTRSIPILNYYQRLGHQIWIACEPDSAAATVLASQFPQAKFWPLQGYNISYAKSKKKFALKILLQIPKILASIRREQKFVHNMVIAHPIKLIISDNRYGFYHKVVKSVFITHQLRIAAPFYWLENWIQKINYRYIQRFDGCWVPDFEGQPNMAGKLSHPVRLPAVPVFYMGALSRLTRKVAATTPFRYTYLFLLSGPEPQRSILEQRLLSSCQNLQGNVLLIRGLPRAKNDEQLDLATSIGYTSAEQNITIRAYADAEALSVMMEQAEFIVCRSGYSTVMELLVLQKKAIFIPTPGQTEQEYLAGKLHAQNWAFSFKQSDTDYPTQFKLARQFSFQLPQLPAHELEHFLDNNGQPDS